MEIDKQIQKLDEQLKLKTTLMVQYELDEDVANQKSVVEEIKKIKIEKIELDEKKNAYMLHKNKGILTEKEKGKIRDTYTEEKQVITLKRTAAYDKKEEIKNNIKVLERQMEEIDKEITSLDSEIHFSLNTKIDSILENIDPRIRQLNNYMDRNTMRDNWLRGNEYEHFFKPKAEHPGVVYSEREIPIVEKPTKLVKEYINL